MKRIAAAMIAACMLAAAQPAAAVVYGLKSCAPASVNPTCSSFGGSPSSAPTNLFSFNEDGTGFADLGRVRIGAADIDADGLAASAAYGLLGFRLDGAPNNITGSTLIAIPTASPGASSVVDVTIDDREIRGATFDHAGNLWAIDAAANEILRVDPASGAEIAGSARALKIGLTGYDVHDGTDLAVGHDGTMLMVSYDSLHSAANRPTFYVVDPGTGGLAFQHVDTVADNEHAAGTFYPGLAISEAGPANTVFAYEANAQEDIMRFTVPAYTRAEIISNFIPGYNAGRGDLAALASVTISAPVTLLLFGLGGGATLWRMGARRPRRASA